MKMEVKMRMMWGSQIKEQPLGAAKCKELDSALEPPDSRPCYGVLSNEMQCAGDVASSRPDHVGNGS